MNAKTAPEASKLDGLKWLLVLLLVGAGIAGNAHFAEESLLYRVLGLVAITIVAGFIAITTAKGVAFWTLLKEARVEIRKVVWPTKAETRQTTLIVLGVVLLIGLILWGLDSALSWAISVIIG